MSDLHPSFFALDCLATGAPVSAEVREHVSGCDVCRAHAERVTLAEAEPVPAWARQPVARLAGIRRFRVAWALAPALFAAAAGIALWIGQVPDGGDSGPGLTTPKGFPTVGLYIKSLEHVRLWDGLSPVHVDDALRIKVAAGEFSHVSVFSETTTGASGAQKLRLLYQGTLTAERVALLPKAWRVDAAPGPEVLVVALGHQPITVAAMRRRPLHRIWTTRLSLPKVLPKEESP